VGSRITASGCRERLKKSKCITKKREAALTTQRRGIVPWGLGKEKKKKRLIDRFETQVGRGWARSSGKIGAVKVSLRGFQGPKRAGLLACFSGNPWQAGTRNSLSGGGGGLPQLSAVWERFCLPMKGFDVGKRVGYVSVEKRSGESSSAGREFLRPKG